MKHISFFIIFFLSKIGIITAQIMINQGVTSTLVYGKQLDSSEESIEGSKYLDKNFELFSVNGSETKYLIRYNAFEDIMEYKSETNSIYLLNKDVTKSVENKFVRYELINENNLAQYHQILLDINGIKLTKFQKINFIKARPAKNAYEEGVPASYKKVKDKYFIISERILYPFDGKKSTLNKIFPSKHDVIEDFYKRNILDFNDISSFKDLLKLL